MNDLIPETHLDLLADETSASAYLATTMPDGSPQVTPVWFDTENGYLRINSVRGRVKGRNMTERAQVAVLIMKPSDTLRYLQIRGSIVRITEEGARAHIDTLSQKYLGKDYPWYNGETRVTFYLEPDSVDTMG